MNDTNSKAQVTEEAIRKAGKAVIDHMADNGLTYEAVAQELTDCLMRIVDPDFIAALTAQEKPEPGVAVAWESAEEWEIELKAFHAAGRKDVPADVQDLIQKLWSMYCDAAAPSPDLPEGEESR